ncbi:MAG: Ammonia monooxygenase gamma subunit [Gammaproteobacteria bacterium]|nr:Ammonia monooxygenase gamma subunit [Gammaproteobacteria bacterium]
MKKLILILILAAVSPSSLAAEATEPLDPVYTNLGNKASLQRGAKLFVNYCLSCHSAAYMRYNRMGRDLGISQGNIDEHMMFAADKPGALMTVSMPEVKAKQWFGTAPPDLSLITRVRKPEWVYSYLRRFYFDAESPHGWNNSLFENVAMPHVLYELQGVQRLTGHDEHGYPRFEMQAPGTMTPEEYDEAMQDLTNFLVYLGEPAKLERYKIGTIVMLFLAGLLVLSYFLKKEYWRDIHYS